MDNELQTLRHTASHILAQAVKRLYPQAKLAIGPAIENGFITTSICRSPSLRRCPRSLKRR